MRDVLSFVTLEVDGNTNRGHVAKEPHASNTRYMKVCPSYFHNCSCEKILNQDLAVETDTGMRWAFQVEPDLGNLGDTLTLRIAPRPGTVMALIHIACLCLLRLKYTAARVYV